MTSAAITTYKKIYQDQLSKISFLRTLVSRRARVEKLYYSNLLQFLETTITEISGPFEIYRSMDTFCIAFFERQLDIRLSPTQTRFAKQGYVTLWFVTDNLFKSLQMSPAKVHSAYRQWEKNQQVKEQLLENIFAGLRPEEARIHVCEVPRAINHLAAFYQYRSRKE